MSPTIYVDVESATYAALRAEILAARARTAESQTDRHPEAGSTRGSSSALSH